MDANNRKQLVVGL